MPSYLQSNSQGTPQQLADLGPSGYRGPNSLNIIGRGGTDFSGFPGAAQGPQLQMPPMMMGQQTPMGQNPLGVAPGNPMSGAPGNSMTGQPIAPYVSPNMGQVPAMAPQVPGGGAVSTGMQSTALPGGGFRQTMY